MSRPRTPEASPSFQSLMQSAERGYVKVRNGEEARAAAEERRAGRSKRKDRRAPRPRVLFAAVGRGADRSEDEPTAPV